MRYVALLRGINVGGNNKVAMAELASTFEDIGMTNVVTYINSGNVLFDSQLHDELDITKQIEQAIIAKFGFAVYVVTISRDNFLHIAKRLPDTWANNTEMKSDVMFLWKEIDSPTILEKLTIKPEIDTVLYEPGALLWMVERKHAGKSGIMKLAGSDIYKKMTIRNCNTVRKLAALLT